MTKRTLEEGQWVLFQPSAMIRNAQPVKAQVTRVWGPHCVNLAVSYDNGVRIESSVLVRYPGDVRPHTGYYCVPKDESS